MRWPRQAYIQNALHSPYIRNFYRMHLAVPQGKPWGTRWGAWREIRMDSSDREDVVELNYARECKKARPVLASVALGLRSGESGGFCGGASRVRRWFRHRMDRGSCCCRWWRSSVRCWDSSRGCVRGAM